MLLPAAAERAAAWQPEVCRAFLQVERAVAVGYVGDLTIWERLTLDALATRVTAPQPPGAGPQT